MTIIDDLGLAVVVKLPLTNKKLQDNLVLNPGFETAGGGGADVFANWTEDTNSGSATITLDTTKARSGTNSCKIFSDTGGEVTGGFVSQDFTVEESTVYHLSFWTQTNTETASERGRYSIRDVTNAQPIVPRMDTWAFSPTTWEEVTDTFTTPPGCVTVRVYLYQNFDALSAVWYDDVSVVKKVPIERAPIQAWAELHTMDSYTHTISASGGYDKMTVTTAGSEDVITDWMESGVFRDVVVLSNTGTVWEGFINEVAITLGGLTMTVGPLMDMVNRARVVYRTINWNTNPPVGGDTVRGTWLDVEDSQERYGILEGVLTGGEGTATEMRQLVSAVIEESAWPEIIQNFTLGTAGDMRITLNCLGYIHLLGKYLYYQTGDAGTENISDKMRKILAANPNDIIDAYAASIETNTTQIHKYEDDDKTALSLIKNLITLSDSSFNRYVFGVYKNKVFEYKSVPEEPSYYQKVSSGTVENENGDRVLPWNVLPARWMRITDFMAGKDANPIAFRSDPRNVFIEDVTYTAPYGLTLSGGKVSRFRQRLNRLGLGGI